MEKDVAKTVPPKAAGGKENFAAAANGKAAAVKASDGDVAMRDATPSNDRPTRADGAAAGASPSPAGTQPGATGASKGVTLPLEVGAELDCLWRDKRLHPVRIIERQKRSKGGEDEYKYYVHYKEFNRRLDEWVTLDKLDLTTIRRSGDGGKGAGSKGSKGGDGKDKHGRSGQKKRKHDPALADHEHGLSGHGGHGIGGGNVRVHDPHGDPHGHGDGHEEFDPASLREHEEFTKVKNIQFIELGRFEMETWYFSPFPPEYNDCDKLYFCEFDLAFFKTKKQLQRHMEKVHMLHPPGDEIYRNTYRNTKTNKDVTLSFFEIDGRKEKIFCQNLCYLAKLFLDHKTLYYDVDLFLFYILCEVDERGCHPVGYFSKEKHSEENYNLACILMFPSHQRKGYGKLLISFSYELSKKEKKVGTPERPLSDLGAVSYYSYWTFTVLNVLKAYGEDNISIKDLSDMTAIMQSDIISTLQRHNLIQYQKGQHVICADPNLLDRHIANAGNFRYLVDESKLIWTPFQLGKEYGGA